MGILSSDEQDLDHSLENNQFFHYIDNINYITIKESNGDEYKGERVEKQKHGRGILTYANHEKFKSYDGFWKNKTLITNASKRNSYASLHKLSSNNKLGNLGNLSSKNVIKKHASIDSLMRDKIHRNLSLYQKISDIYHNSSNQINNYLNMNINVNINLNNNGINKYHYSTSSLDDDAACNSDEYEDQYEIQLDENNKIIKSPIQTEENFPISIMK